MGKGSIFSYICHRKGAPLQSLTVGSCLTLWNELSKETQALINRKALLGMGTWEIALPVQSVCACVSVCLLTQIPLAISLHSQLWPYPVSFLVELSHWFLTLPIYSFKAEVLGAEFNRQRLAHREYWNKGQYILGKQILCKKKKKDKKIVDK